MLMSTYTRRGILYRCRTTGIPLLCLALFMAACTHAAPQPGKSSAFARLVPAEQIEQQSALQYTALKNKASKSNALVPLSDPQFKRISRIAARLIPQATRWNPRAAQWNWEVVLLRSDQINAFCMPAGKIAFYTGLLDKLQPTDDEIAAVMGHEMAHALREHARAQAGKGGLTQIGANILGQAIGAGQYAQLFETGGQLLVLKYSRDDETEADLAGVDIAARAGFDPRAALSLWKKMSAAGGSSPPQWLSTHPANSTRIRDIEGYLPQVLPAYESARGTLKP
jgi:predicted Zn-dependent protease